MSEIHKNNCEAFFLDYYEGRLDAGQQRMLFEFLRENPKWEKVFDEYGRVSDGDVIMGNQDEDFMPFADRPVLRDDETDLIALLEGQLNQTDAHLLQQKIARNAAVAATYRRYELTRLKPDMSVVFPDKQRLKKGAPILTLFTKYSAIAALMAGAFIAVWIFSIEDPAATTAIYQPRQQESKNPKTSPLEGGSENPTSYAASERNSVPVATQNLPLQKSHEEPLAENRGKNSNTVKSDPTAMTSPDKVTELFVAERVVLKSMNSKTQSTALLTAVKTDAPQLVQPELPGSLPEVQPVQPIQPVEPNNSAKKSERSLFGTFLSDIGQTVVERVKAATDEEVVIENEEHPDDELVTSTFRLGAFEVYRSKSKK